MHATVCTVSALALALLVAQRGSAPAADYPSQTIKIIVPFTPGGGAVRLLGVTSAKRSAVLPDDPTIAESAVPGFEAGVWFALFAPAGTPKAVVDLLNSKVNAALVPAEVREGFLKVGNEPVGGGPDVLAAKVQSELQKWTTIVREKNIRIDP